jgi:DNA-directed RNA polymerase specialized sigma24 family protein
VRWITEVAPTDEMLMQAFAAGDSGAFETLYDRNLPAVWRYVLRSVHDAALADELVQDVWVSIVRQAPLLPAPRALSHLAVHAGAPPHGRSLAHPPSARQPGCHGPRTAPAWPTRWPRTPASARCASCSRASRRMALLDALAALPAVQREAFLLHAEGAMSRGRHRARPPACLAETARSRLRYARATLRQTLEGCAVSQNHAPTPQTGRAAT